MICRNCKNEIPVGSNVCPYCGTLAMPEVLESGLGEQYENPTQNQMYVQQQAKSKSNKAKAVVISIVAVVLVIAIVIASVFIVRSKNNESDSDTKDSKVEKTTVSHTVDNEETTLPAKQVTVKIGIITLHDENSNYDLFFLNGLRAACDNKNVKYVIKSNIPEGQECYEAAKELVNEGCNVIFADSFGHEDYLIKAAEEFSNVDFITYSGIKAHTENLPNYHNAYIAYHESNYVLGIAAGEKINQMIKNGEINKSQAKLGYVASFAYSEVISSYTAFYIGAKSVCPSVTMDVIFTGSWYDETLEYSSAERLIYSGCKVINQSSYSPAVPNACEDLGASNVSVCSYSSSSNSLACVDPNWQPYFEYVISCVGNGKNFDADWLGTFSNSSIKASGKYAVNTINTGIDELKSGTLHVFDINTFTVNGKTLTSYMADVDSDPNFYADTEIVKDGYVHECEYRSAPYFDIKVDGIQLLNVEY